MIQGPTKIGLVQINNSFSHQNYLPYSVGVLQAYAVRHLTHPRSYEFLLPLYRRLSVPEAVARLDGARAVFFSVYVWNVRITLAIAQALKARDPETLIAFGGPQVPTRSEAFLRAHPFIDVACHGEGERTFVALLEDLSLPAWRAVPGVSFLAEGQWVAHPPPPRLSDLSQAPSPYVEGIFEPLMRAHPEEQWLCLWETNRGCPFSCTFCDWGSAVQAKVYPFSQDRLRAEVEWFARRRIEFVFCCDANFGILKRDVEIAELVAQTKRRTGYPKALSVQNTKNATERAYQVQKTLAVAELNKGVTISLQSTDPQTLESVKRQNISSGSFQELQRRFTRDGIETYSDVILGLPGETYDTYARGVDEIIRDGQHNRIQFNNLSVLPNAEMGDPEYQRRFGMQTVETKIVNFHGALEEDEIYETQELVVGTSAMPPADWCRARAFSWMAALLHFDKVLQIPFALLHAAGGVGFRELIERFADRTGQDTPVLLEIRQFFLRKAREIQAGGPEYCRGESWLPIWWPADEYILIRLCYEDKLDRFFEEAGGVLSRLVEDRRLPVAPQAIREAVALNQALLKRPFMSADLRLELSYNIWQVYRAVVRGEALSLAAIPSTCHIDRTSEKWSSWNDWCREVIWYGNKKGAYLYGNRVLDHQIAGHF